MGVDLTGIINFYSHTKDGSRPCMDATPTLGYPQTNYVQIPTEVPIYDLRGKENQFNLDENGFEVHKYGGNIHNAFDDNSEEQRTYYDDTINLLKNRLGASHVIVFWHVIRFRGTPRPADQCDQTHRNPVFYPHVDCAPLAAKSKVIEILGEDEGEKRMKNRFQIVNTWKRLGPNSIANIPLSICDYQSIDTKNDIHSSEVIASTNSVSLYMISRNINNAQKWYYLSNMRSDEMFVLKIYDTNPNVAQFGAHTAFTNPNTSSPTIEQCSVETRSLVFYDQ